MNNIKICIAIIFCAVFISFVLMNANDDIAEKPIQNKVERAETSNQLKHYPEEDALARSPNQKLVITDEDSDADIDLIAAPVVTPALRESIIMTIDNALANQNNRELSENIDQILAELAGLIGNNQEAADFLSVELANRLDLDPDEDQQEILLEIMLALPAAEDQEFISQF